MLSFLLNVLWFVLGGLVMGLGWWLAGLLCAITIVGLPWARACFVIGSSPFGPLARRRSAVVNSPVKPIWAPAPWGSRAT